jgi:parallel beta-helix repeat protein
MVVADNEFSHDAPNGDSVGGTSGAFKLWYDSDVQVLNNWVHDSGTVGMWADTDNNGVVFEGNYVDHNANEGLIYEISYNALIENNTFVDNGWKAGPGNPGFPTGAIYVFSSGGEPRVPNGFGITTLTISGNVFTDNYGGVVLYQNGDRVCGFSDGSNCTLIDPTVYTSSSCAAHITETSPVDYFDNCVWKTQNATVTGNHFSYNRSVIPSCTRANTCAYSALFGTYSGITGRTGATIPLAVSNQQKNHFANNTYHGGLGFMAFNQGDKVTWPQWTQGFVDGSSRDTFSPQDAGSTFS